MNVLIVTAHPASWGFTHEIARVYKKESEKLGKEVFVLNLYDPEYAQPFLRFEDMKRDMVITDTHKRIQEKIAWADELVFVFPVWWVGAPAILKNMFDQNLTPKFAYKYQQNGSVDRLLKGKSARVFATADGPRHMYVFARPIWYLFWHFGILGFCGVRIKSFDIFADMIHRRVDDERAGMLLKVVRRARA